MQQFLAENFPYREENAQKLVVVGMSGGVDSSVAAALLQHQGYRVVGLFMKNWEEKDESGVCTSAQDFADAAHVCEVLNIPYYSVEFVTEYWQNVFSQVLREYELGLTPNPDILCNREIKFKAFFERAMSLGADFLATGHYTQTKNGELLKGADPLKDQSYFLYAVKKEVLEKVLFPVGHLKKTEVRALAQYFQLPTQAKKDSTGICFIGERNFRQFLSQYIRSEKGSFQTLEGEIVGEHVGVPFYTVGQRKGLGLGGAGEPWFVVDKDPTRNIVFVERGEEHPGLFADELWASDLEWVGAAPDFKTPQKLKAKIRYRQGDQDCVVEEVSTGRVRVSFPVPQRAITLGQSVVFYREQVCLGGGVITQVGESFFTKSRRDLSPADLSFSL